MFGSKKNKENEYNINKYLDNSIEYELHAKLHKEIKDYYSKKITNKEIDLQIERTRIEINLGKNIRIARNLSLLAYIAIFGGVILAIITTVIEHFNNFNILYA
jgi:hypothetical protein